MSGKIYSDGHEVDGSWVLQVYVTDLNIERSLRVKGELHIGGVMLRLVEDLGKFFFAKNKCKQNNVVPSKLNVTCNNC